MAKTDTKDAAAVATIPAAGNTQMTAQTSGPLAPAPSYLDDGREGLEDITKSDIIVPRLALAQALSPQVTDGDPNQIPGLKPGDLFNSMTGEIYAQPVVVQILRKDKLRAMQFRDINDGGGVLDPDVPLNDARCAWGEDGEKPEATVFRDYIARIIPSGELIALSFKSSGIKVAKQLNGMITLRGRSIYTGLYAFTTAQELKPKPHKVFKVANAGWVAEADAVIGKQMYDSLKNVDLSETIDREQGYNEATDFNPSSLENGGGGERPAADM